jgi:hypothetical protein
MPGIFSHRLPTPPVRHYRSYRLLIREDFQECCAYCLLHEFFVHGEQDFELDHFKPKSNEMFAHLKNDYKNIYYSCHVCNRNKHAHWPPSELIAKGVRFIDPCKEDFATHYKQEDNGYWRPLTPAGAYTAKLLRLNSTQLVTFRRWLIELMHDKGFPKIDWNKPLKSQIEPLIYKN